VARIIKAEIFKHAYDMRGYKLATGVLDKVYPVLLKLTDSDRAFGWGEANPEQPFTVEDADDTIAALKRLLAIVMTEEDQSPIAVDQRLLRERPDKDLMAKGAINVALMDLEGKRRDLPVSALLGEIVRQSLPVSHPLSNGTADDDIPLIDRALSEGYVHFMLKMGMPGYPVSGEVERVARLQERYGNRITIKVDANTGWTREQAWEFLTGVSDYPIFVEQPLAKHDLEGMAVLQANTGLRLSVDESLTGMASAEEVVARHAARVFSIKISKNGGILRAQAIARMAEQNGILCYPNSMSEGGITQAASLHLAATLTNLVAAGGAFKSVLRLDGDVTNFHTFIRDGIVHLPEGAGLGIKVDEARLRSGTSDFAPVTLTAA
jgi:muconate cycloisomerase